MMKLEELKQDKFRYSDKDKIIVLEFFKNLRINDSKARKYLKSLESNEIFIHQLAALDTSQMKEIGIITLGVRMRIYNRLHEKNFNWGEYIKNQRRKLDEKEDDDIDEGKD